MVLVVVVRSGGGGCVLSLCKGGSFNIYRSAIVKCPMHGKVGDKNGDEGGGGGDDGCGVSGGDGGGQERNPNNKL